uniref:ATP-dependent (S)-NAD(P)H-hydrate dehydratase n=1 Tax=Blastobotrys adeninivorans TaxID=409370 RepID=A0A060THH9_BLAAD
MSALKGKGTQELINLTKKIVPPLLDSFHKGQAGRVAIVGGSEDYTGAPYFSAMASTLLGADMSHVICDSAAGTVIKSYSPNLMVHPYLHSTASLPESVSEKQIMDRVASILDRVHVIVVGPGLGRDSLMQKLAANIIEAAKQREMPIVIDADGLYLIQNQVELVKGYTNAILTPNVVEFKRLQEAVGIDPSKDGTSASDKCKQLALKFGGLVIIQKGSTDFISNGTVTITGDLNGSKKRVSGQGDTLSGSLATFMAWRLAYHNGLWDHPNELSHSDTMLLAAFGGSCITRNSARLAFENYGRSMVTSNLSDYIGKSYSELLEDHQSHL